MAVIKVACPECGEVANATVNSKSDEIINISKKSTASYKQHYQSSCKECGGSFYYDVK